MVAGARYDIDLRRPAGDRIPNLSVSGRPVRPTDSFTLALNSYRQAGSGGYTMLRGAPVVYDKGENIRDLLVEEIGSRRGELDPADYARPATGGSFPEPQRPQRCRRSSDTEPSLTARPKTASCFGYWRPRTYTEPYCPRADPDGKAGRRGGAGGGLMDSLTAECGCPTVRLDAGNAMQGTVMANVTRGRAMVEVLNRLNITAATLGEHDFEWSLDTLRLRMSEAHIPGWPPTSSTRRAAGVPPGLLRIGW